MSILDTIKAFFCSNTDSVESKTSAPADVAPKASEPNVSSKTSSATASQIQIPEDSALKRHFMSNLKREVEAKMQARPTESTLKRHYDSAVQAEIEKILG